MQSAPLRCYIIINSTVPGAVEPTHGQCDWSGLFIRSLLTRHHLIGAVRYRCLEYLGISLPEVDESRLHLCGATFTHSLTPGAREPTLWSM